MKMKSHNSHICVPKQTLLHFSKDGSLRYLDTKERCVRKSTPKSFLTGKDYYTSDSERFLSARLETSMGRIYKLVDNFRTGQQQTFNAGRDLFEFTRDAIAIQLLRNPDYYRKHILPCNPMGPQGRNGAKAAANKVLNDELFNLYRDTEVFQFNSYCAMPLINKTSNNFLLPSLHFYIVQRNGFDTFILILSQKNAIALMSKEDYEKTHMDDDGPSYPMFDDPNIINLINEECIKFEHKYGTGKIVGEQGTLNEIGKKLGFIDNSVIET